MELIKSCILDMESLGIHQWNEYYPTLDIIIGDIESGIPLPIVKTRFLKFKLSPFQLNLIEFG